MRRFFSKRQKKILAMISGNQCSICQKYLDPIFHGDHIVPFIKKGKTIIKNGQALCAECNLKKGSKI
tara:strand:- start:63 stop:263 length:201 start_codon:yes stop_codon:yes gene_type:complete